MKALLQAVDSMTGECEPIELNVESFTGAALAKAYDDYLTEGTEAEAGPLPKSVCQSFVVSPNGRFAAFIFVSADDQWDYVLTSGVVYLDFVVMK